MGAAKSVVTGQAISLSLLAALKAAGFKAPDDFSVTIPPNRQLGDLTSDIALRAAPLNQVAPSEVAAGIVQHFRKPPAIAACTVAGPGFINFTVSDSGWEQLLAAWLTGKIFYSDAYRNQIVVVEFSSPNVGKPFSVGHLRSTILGDAVARLYEHSGAKTIRVNHLGDWGTQFGKLIYAINTWGEVAKIERNPVQELLALYVKFHAEAEQNPALNDRARKIFAELEQGDVTRRGQWQQVIDWSLTEYNELYRRLGVEFDHLTDRGESFYTTEMMTAVLAQLRQHGLVKQSEGAAVLCFPHDELPSTVLVRGDGASVYLLRDLAALRYRLTEWHADRIIYHVGSEQTLHFRQLVRAAELAGWLAEVDGKRPEVLVAIHGRYRLPSGEMSTRRGKGILLSDLLSYGVSQAATLIKSKEPSLDETWLAARAETMAVGAIKYNDLAHNRTSPITFEWGRALNLEGNSAPYLMYAHARAHGIFRQAKQKLATTDFDLAAITPLLTLPKERELILMVIPLYHAFTQATTNAMPHYIAATLFDLAQKFNSYYHETTIITADQPLTQARLAIVKAVAQTIQAGLELLGVAAPEQL